MFGFVFKNSPNIFNIIYDGNKSNIRLTLSSVDAEDYFTYAKNLKKVKKIIAGQMCEATLNIMENGEVITDQFLSFLKENKGISSRIVRAWTVYIKEFDVVRDGFEIGFRSKGVIASEGTINPGLFLMKEFIVGLFRLSDITILNKDGKDGNNKEIALPMQQHFDGQGPDKQEIPYNYQEYLGTTPIYGVYAPQLRKMMFEPFKMNFGDGRMLQRRQAKAFFEAGYETYLAAPRSSGKSLFAGYWVMVDLFRTVVRRKEMGVGVTIHYYGPTHKSNMEIKRKIMSMNSTFRGSLFKRSEKDQTLSLFSGGKEVARLMFLSGAGIEPGRGDRPTFIVVDEAAKISEDVYKNIQSGYSGVPKLYITTIDSKTKKNWFYEGLISAEMDMVKYTETTEEVVVQLWKKYGLDKVKSITDLQKEERIDKLAALREDYFQKRPAVGLRFTIDDAENFTPWEKEMTIKAAKKMGLDYLLAEHYSEFAERGALLNYKLGRIPDKDIPTEASCDYIVMSLDHAESYDNPALSIIGVKGDEIYPLDSLLLEKDEKERIKQLQDTIKYYKARNKFVYVVIDCTQSPTTIRSFYEDRGVYMDMAIYQTHGKQIKSKEFEVIGKEALITEVTPLFNGGKIKIADKFDQPKGLLEELENFEEIKTKTGKSSYMAVKGKDDQVMALLYAIHFACSNGLSEKIANSDTNSIEQKFEDIEDYYDYLEKKTKKKETIDRYEQAEAELFLNYGF